MNAFPISSLFVPQWIAIAPTPRPDPTIPSAEKDEDYHSKCWRSFMGRNIGLYQNHFRLQYAICSSFGRGQWGYDEDRLTFLRDGTRETTRKELAMPMMSPAMKRLRGQASSIAISATAVSTTQYFEVRKETALNMALAHSIAAGVGGPVQQTMQSRYGITPDQQKTQEGVVGINGDGGAYQDEELMVANGIMQRIESENDFEFLKNSNADTVSCSGLFATHCQRKGMSFRWEFMHPYDTFWDVAANRLDFKDGEYAGHFPLMNLSTLSYMYQPKREELHNLAEQARLISTSQQMRGVWPQGKPRVATCYWNEPELTKRGWVIHPGDQKAHLCVLYEKDMNGVQYTKDDCLALTDPRIPKNVDLSDWSDKVDERWVEVVRYCTGIPHEYTPYASVQNAQYDSERRGDVILSWGINPFQDPDPESPNRTNLPIKLCATEYQDGYITSPLWSMIGPQRVVNQVVSDLVWRMGKAGNESPVMDIRALSGTNQSIEDVAYAQKEGNIIFVDSMGQGVNQVIGKSDTSPGPSFYNLWSVIPQIVNIGQSGTGLYDSAQGKSQGQDQAVGTTNLLLQQTNLMMEGYSQTWKHGFRQMHQFDVQAGKTFYADYPDVLAQMIGDKGAALVTQDRMNQMRLEQFRAEVEINVNPVALKAATDQLILSYVNNPVPLLGVEEATEMLGRSFPSDVPNGVRKSVARKAKAAEDMAAQQQQQQQAATLAQGQQDLNLRKQQAQDQALKSADEAAKNQTKLKLPVVSQMAKAAIPEPQQVAAP